MPELGPSAMETESAFMAAAGALVLLLATLRRRRDGTALLFALLAGAFAVWGGARGAEALGWAHGARASAFSLLALGSLAPTVATAFARGVHAATTPPALAWWAPALAAGAAAAAWPEHAAVRIFAGTWALFGGAAATLLLARHQAPAPGDPSPDATRLRYLGIAQGIAVAGAVGDVAAWQLGAARIGGLLAPLLYLYTGYLHLCRVRVADLRQLMGNAVALALLAGGLAAAFAALWIWVGARVNLFVFNAFVASFLLLLMLEPCRSVIQRAMDQRFVAARLELERSLAPLRERLPHLLTLDAVLAELLDTLERTERLRASAVYLRDDPQVGFQQVGSVGLPPRRRVNLIRDPIFVDALEQRPALLEDELEKVLAGPRPPEDTPALEGLLHLLHQLDAQLALPLRTEASGLLGFWTLSDERSSEPFSSSELDFLQEVAGELAAAIENSRTFERVRTRDRLASLGEMAAGLAHEIRNPLATIRGAIAVIDEETDDTSREFHDVMVQEIERLDRVVGTFLDYARPLAPPSRIADLAAFVEACVRGTLRQLDSDLPLELELESGLESANANADQLERVLANLVTNAVQACEGRGAIRVSLHKGEGDAELLDGNVSDFVQIAIEDSGPGMDDATLERALDPFFTTKDGGTGLGLALCDRLVRAQGGTLRLRSQPGVGTKAIIRLPGAVPVEPGTDDAPGENA